MASYEQIFARKFGDNQLRLFYLQNVKFAGFARTNLYELVFLEYINKCEGYQAVCTEYFSDDEGALAYVAFETRAISENPWAPTKYQRSLQRVIPNLMY